MKWFWPLLLIAAPAVAQTDPAGSMLVGDHQHGTSGIESDIEALKGLFDDHMSLYHTEEPPIEPPVEPPIPPVKPGNFAKLCAEPGVVYCQGFDVDLSEADFNNGDTRDYPIAIDNTVFAEGGGSLRLTVNGAHRREVTGTIGYDFPQITSGTFYVGLKMRFGDELQTLLRSQGFNHYGAGMKFFQIVAGSRSCSSEEIVFTDTSMSAWLTGVPGLVYSCSGRPIHAPNGDYQPIDNSGKDPCKWRTIEPFRDSPEKDMVGWEPCRVFEDDTWHQVELEVRIGDGYRLWLDGNLTVDTQVWPPAGPYGRFYMSNYITGYDDRRMQGSGTFGDGLWRIYYDNLIISRDCITSCGG